MGLVDGRTCETCVYVYRSARGEKTVLLVKRSQGANAGKWVPLGRAFDQQSSPHDQAITDLLEVGLAGAPRLRGVVTETSAEGGWQCVLFLFAVEAPAQWEPTENSLCAMEWHPVAHVGQLDTPQADRHFDLALITDPARPVFHASMSFTGEGILSEVANHP